MVETKPTAIIIGSGVAGLATAVRLAVQGFQVKIFEKNNSAGGKITQIKSGNYCFDAGPSLFVLPENIEELFALANEPIEKYFQYQPVDIACKYFYEDGTVVNAYSNAERFANELKNVINEDDKAVINYLQQSKNNYQKLGEIFLNQSLHKIKTWVNTKVFKTLLKIKTKYIFKNLHQHNQSLFKQKQTVQLFDRYATYNGSSPFKAAAMFSMIPHIEFNEGVFYPKGGMISIANALYKLAIDKGVEFYFNSNVERIINTENKVNGVVVNNENHFANVVVSNMDVYFTYKHLLRDESKTNKIAKQERSSSALIFYWGIKKEFPQLQLHNIFFSEDYNAEFSSIFKSKTFYNDSTIYINITNKEEPNIHAPQGKENWFVMVNVPSNNKLDWNELKEKYKQAIIQKLNRILKINLEDFIETEEILTPALIEKNTSSYLGSLYGSSSNSILSAFLRHPNFSNTIRGLYFVGGSVHPGGGIPLCFKSAKIAAELIQHSYKKHEVHH
jgi:phytoene desaturase